MDGLISTQPSTQGALNKYELLLALVSTLLMFNAFLIPSQIYCLPSEGRKRPRADGIWNIPSAEKPRI